ncbi:MAG: HD domain-containing protein [Chloroflexi bacterium]|nr:HD domain-containing protein [Chloroflexota bacterium]
MNATLLALGEVFHQHGRQLYLVGGTVRDRLLGRQSPDIDLTTDAPPDEIKRLVAHIRPDAVYAVGERFGTIGMIVGGQRLEITTFRSEQYEPRSRKPTVAFGTSLEADLARRDFTINAIAQEIASGALIDPFGGLADLDRRQIRAVGEPAERFAEDPLRLLRAIRLAVQLDFRIEAATAVAIRRRAAALQHISRERINEEMTKILLSARTAEGLRMLVDYGLMRWIVSEVLDMRGMVQEGFHHKDVYEHVLMVVDSAAELKRFLPEEKQLRLMWAALLHDIGKPRTRGLVYECLACGNVWTNGRAAAEKGDAQRPTCPVCQSREVVQGVHFRWHEQVGAEMARAVLTRLHLDNETIEAAARLVLLHTRANSYSEEWTDGAVRRFIREIDDDLDALLALSRADVTTRRAAKAEAALARTNELEARCRAILERENVPALTSPLDGHELMALFGRGPGPWIRDVKDYLLGQVLEGTLAPDDKERAAELAHRFVAAGDVKA